MTLRNILEYAIVLLRLDDWVFTEQTAHQKLYKHFNVKSLKGFGVDHLKNGVIAAGAYTPIFGADAAYPDSPYYIFDSYRGGALRPFG